MVNCLTHKKFCDTLIIPVFPEIRIYVKEHPISYNGPKIREYLEKYIKEKIHHHPTELKNKQDLYKLRIRKSGIDSYKLDSQMKIKLLRGIFIFYGNREKDEFHWFDISSKIDNDYEWAWTENMDVINHLKELRSNDSKHLINKNTKVIFMNENSNQTEAMHHLKDKEFTFRA